MSKIRGSNKNDKLVGSRGNDTILGLGGNDAIISLAGNDRLSGGSGDDVFILEAGGKTIDGGEGLDGIDLLKAKSGIVFDFALGEVDYVVGGKTGHATFKNIEAVRGTDKADVITGDDNANYIVGAGGGDTISCGGGNDSLFDAWGDDNISGDDGDDTFEVFGGFDTINGGEGLDVIDLHENFDAVNFSVADNLLENSSPWGHGFLTYYDIEGVIGTDFDDVLRGDGEENSFHGGGGDDYINAASGNDTVDGGAGDDTIETEDGDDLIIISSGNDTIESGPVQNGGSDTIDFRNAIRAVTVALDDGTASFEGRSGSGVSTFVAIDNINGSKFGDTLSGDERDNILRGMGGGDMLDGLAGDDILVSDAGDEIMKGGAGADAFLFTVAPGPRNFDILRDFTPGDDALWFARAAFNLQSVGPDIGRLGFEARSLADGQFQSGDTSFAATADVRLIYETDSGILWYDADGSEAGSSIAIAQLSADLLLDATDILVA